MVEVFSFKTIESFSEGIYKEKGSKFIAYAVPCRNEDEAKEYLEQWRKQHHQARHVCYAYRFGPDHSVYRANDDGEPNNSAGIPILGQIKSFELTDVLVGVVRYFGGTKLGVGGLINAYKESARDALLNAKIVEKEVYRLLDLKFNYSLMSDIMSVLKKFDLEMAENRFEMDCFVKLEVPLRIYAEVEETFSGMHGLEIKKY